MYFSQYDSTDSDSDKTLEKKKIPIICLSSDEDDSFDNGNNTPNNSEVNTRPQKHIPLIIIDDSDNSELDDQSVDLPDWETLQVIDLDIQNAFKHSVPIKHLDPIELPIEVDVSFGLKTHEPSDSSCDESENNLRWDISYYERRLANTRLSSYMRDFYEEKLEQAQRKIDDVRNNTKCIKLAICKKRNNKKSKSKKSNSKIIIKKLKM